MGKSGKTTGVNGDFPEHPDGDLARGAPKIWGEVPGSTVRIYNWLVVYLAL